MLMRLTSRGEYISSAIKNYLVMVWGHNLRHNISQHYIIYFFEQHTLFYVISPTLTYSPRTYLQKGAAQIRSFSTAQNVTLFLVCSCERSV